jgi:hypothetical protein
MFHLLSYYGANAAGATLLDTPMVTDGVLSVRNGHPILTEDYEMAANAIFGASITAAQFSDATWNAINIPQIYPVNLSLAVPANPQVNDLRNWPIQMPKNEEIALQLSNNLGSSTEPEFGLVWMRPLGQKVNIPPPASGIGSIGRVRAIFTFTGAITAGVWSSDMVVTITNLIKGGTYCLIGCNVICAHGIAFRWNFVRAPLYQGRKLYPGSLVDAAYGNVTLREGRIWMGPYGYFDTFELPLISILAGTTTTSATYTGYLDLIYLGTNMLSNQVQANQQMSGSTAPSAMAV